ncbi:MAG TPA: TPM domain-containing protein [Steroidobacteraceae bacterium]|jgi:uncharacterized membrane protein|nr:TPM domain-containing protein [Steroidobacteraceae bacterium]
MLFPPAVLGEIERACAQSEARHSGEIRFAIETALPLAALWHGVSPRERALQVFAHLRIWDTHHNNGVLIYVLRADRAVEIVADRGISAAVQSAEWETICREVERHFRAGRFGDGARAAVAAVADLLGRHFPAGAGNTNEANELPNQPVLL